MGDECPVFSRLFPFRLSSALSIAMSLRNKVFGYSCICEESLLDCVSKSLALGKKCPAAGPGVNGIVHITQQQIWLSLAAGVVDTLSQETNVVLRRKLGKVFNVPSGTKKDALIDLFRVGWKMKHIVTSAYEAQMKKMSNSLEQPEQSSSAATRANSGAEGYRFLPNIPLRCDHIVSVLTCAN